MKYDEQKLEQIIEEETKCWVDVPDVNKWVEELRS